MSHRQRAERLAALLRLAEELERFVPGEDPDRLLRYLHREVGGLLGADLGYVWSLGRGGTPESVYYQCWTKRGEQLRKQGDRSRITALAVAFAHDRRAPEDRNLLFTLVESRGRPVGVLAFHRAGRSYSRNDARLANDATQILGRQLEHRERERIYQLRERIVRKVLLQLRPADILYQVLHGLKRLLGYDHSASVHTIDADGSALTPRAEVITWTKGKSPRIGRRMPLSKKMLEVIGRLDPCILIDSSNGDPRVPPELLEEVAVVSPDAPPARSMLLAGLRRRDRPVGLLAIRWRLPNAVFDTDRETINSFLAIVSATALHSEFFRHQQDLLRDAERRTALGDLARAISHDLSNSFGVIQPLLETLRREAKAGTIEREDLIGDLDTLQRYVTASVRIFRGLLSFAHGSVEEAHAIEIEGCLDEVLSLLDRGLKTAGIEVVREIPSDLPRLIARRQDIEQLFLNLLTNAKESMPEGGHLTIRAWLEADPTDSTIGLSIADTGRGIRAEDLTRVFEPFFSTKRGGTGLGLDICRSIVWEYDGNLWLDSDVGRGTVVHVRLPIRGLPSSAGGEAR